MTDPSTLCFGGMPKSRMRPSNKAFANTTDGIYKAVRSCYCIYADCSARLFFMKDEANGRRVTTFLTPKQAADYIGISVRTFYPWLSKPRSKGGPPVRRFGRNVIRLPREQFIRWANAGTED